MAQAPVLSVVDYAAWGKGYMPPSEHVLIDQLAYRGARVALMCDHADAGAFWVVVRGKNLTPAMRKHMRETMELWFEEDSTDAGVATPEPQL